jgi:pimeloyl-ACP methyl ester carboxylesterase
MGLASGAEARVTGDPARGSVVCVNGGQGSLAEGTWSASLEWLVRQLAPRLASLELVEVRYRVKSWRRLRDCVEDARAAIDAAGSDRVCLLGFSMGGAVAVQAAADPRVEEVLGLAPWLPHRLDLSPLRGKRLTVLHGTLDRWLPGVPGVSPASSRAGYERARALGAEGAYTLIPGAVHGVALRAPWGVTPLPRAGRWLELVAAELARFQSAAA